MKEKVLVLPAGELEEFYGSRGFYSSESELEHIDNVRRISGEYIDRDFAESTEKFKQIIAVGIVRCGDEILCIRRTKKSNRKELQLRWTLMFGGHVDDNDARGDNHPLNCLLRELKEELDLVPTTLPELIGFAVDPENKVGRLHIGFVFDVRVDNSFVHLHRNLDNSEFVNSTQSKTYKFMKEDQIQTLYDKLDPWSFIFVKSEIFGDRFRWSRDLWRQGELPLRWA